MEITDIERDGFPMELLKGGAMGVVDEHEFANLFLVEHLAERNEELNSHIWEESYKEHVCIEHGVMIGTHQ